MSPLLRAWPLLLLLLLSLCSPTHAHDLRLSGIRVTLNAGKTVIEATAPLSTLTATEGHPLSPWEMDLVLRRRVRLRFAGKDLAPRRTRLQYDALRDQVLWQTTLEQQETIPEVRARLFPDDPASKTVVSILRGETLQTEQVLDADHPALSDSPVSSGSASALLLRFLREGIGHIFGGPDHICFVFGLILLGGGLRRLLKTVTAFTLAHSVTLTVAALGIWSPPSRLVESLIALSIVAIAGENLRPRKEGVRDTRPWFAFGFGLLHGFGFAGALADVGLPLQARGISLASFNLGIEIGQAAIVLTVAPALAGFARRFPLLYPRLTRLGSIAIGIAGLWWLVTRLLS